MHSPFLLPHTHAAAMTELIPSLSRYLIPSLSCYPTLGSPALTCAATLNGLTIVTQDTTVISAYMIVVRFVEVGCSLANFVP